MRDQRPANGQALAGSERVRKHAVRRKVAVEIAEVGAEHRLSAQGQHAHRGKSPALVQRRRESAEERGHTAHDRDLVVRNPCGERAEAFCLDVEREHGSAVEKRRVNRAHRVGEAERCGEQPAVTRVDAPAIGQVACIGEDTGMGVQHPLGTARRPGRVQNHRQAVRACRVGGIRSGQLRIDVAEIDQVDRASAQPNRVAAVAGIRHHEPGARVGKHVTQAIRRIAGIEDDVELPRLEDAEDGGQRFAAVREHEGDRLGRRTAPGQNRACQAIRRLVERRIAILHTFRLDGETIAMRPHLLLETPRDRLRDLVVPEGSKAAVGRNRNVLQQPHARCRRCQQPAARPASSTARLPFGSVTLARDLLIPPAGDRLAAAVHGACAKGAKGDAVRRCDHSDPSRLQFSAM